MLPNSRSQAPTSEPYLHPRLKYLSFSSVELLRLCPRKFQLKKLSKTLEVELTEVEMKEMQYAASTSEQPEKWVPLFGEEVSIDLTFGKSFGIGIQKLLTSGSREQAILAAFLAWDADIFDEHIKKDKKKNFWWLVYGLQRFSAVQLPELAGQWEVFTLPNGRLASEVSFRLDLGDGFYYRGFIDLVLVNRNTGQLLVLELKTTAAKFVNEAMYGNSDQGLSYLLIMEKLFSGLTQLEVLYLVYKSSQTEFEPFKFPKGLLARNKFVRDLLTTCAIVRFYANFDDFPMHGGSCFMFFRPCTYYGVCQMSNKALLPPLEQVPTEDDIGKV